jgi:hypothetical protein
VAEHDTYVDDITIAVRIRTALEHIEPAHAVRVAAPRATRWGRVLILTPWKD